MEVLFVHGINVRGNEAQLTCDVIQQRLSALTDPVQVTACLWGDVFGAHLGLGGESIPDYGSARAGAGVLDDADRDLMLWELLYADPMIEMRIMSNRGTSGGIPPGVSPADDLASELEALAARDDVARLLRANGLTKHWKSATDFVTGSVELATFMGEVPDPNESAPLIARALVAAVADMAAEEGAPAMQAQVRDALVVLVESAAGGKARGVLSWVLDPLQGLAMRKATNMAKQKRGSLMDAVSPVAGDVIRYQARGARVRAEIAEAIAKSSGQLVVFAHSLGGIALLDTLLESGHLRKNVAQCFTVGSQAGFFYEVDALVGLERGKPMPGDIPPWVNFYDKADLLSFLAEPVFPGRVRDVEVSSGQPFPQSHSAYWTNARLWSEVARVLARD